MLIQAILSIIETALNHYLSLDPESHIRLTVLENKVVAIEEPQFGLKFYLLFTGKHVRLQSHTEKPVDTTLHGTPFALLQLSPYFANNYKAIFSGKVTITGDIELGQQVQQIFANLDIDWEEQLSRVTGDVIAHQVGNTVRDVWQWGKRNTEIFNQNVTEYLQEEIKYVPPRMEINDFFHDIANLRDDVERAEARIKRILQVNL